MSKSRKSKEISDKITADRFCKSHFNKESRSTNDEPDGWSQICANVDTTLHHILSFQESGSGDDSDFD